MGKTAIGTATEGILTETDTLFSRVATWTFSTKMTQEAMGTHANKQLLKKVSVCAVPLHIQLLYRVL
jgi:hypothetical protein